MVGEKKNVAVIDPLADHDVNRQRKAILDLKVCFFFCDHVNRFLRLELLRQGVGIPCHIHKTFGIDGVNRPVEAIHFQSLSGS